MEKQELYLKCKANLTIKKKIRKDTLSIIKFEDTLRYRKEILTWEVRKSRSSYLIGIKKAITLSGLKYLSFFFENLIDDNFISDNTITIEGLYKDRKCTDKVSSVELSRYILRLERLCPRLNVIPLDRIKTEVYNNYKDTIKSRLGVNLFLALHNDSKFVIRVLEEYIHNSGKERSWDGFLYCFERKYGFLIGDTIRPQKNGYSKNIMEGQFL